MLGYRQPIPICVGSYVKIMNLVHTSNPATARAIYDKDLNDSDPSSKPQQHSNAL